MGNRNGKHCEMEEQENCSIEDDSILSQPTADVVINAKYDLTDGQRRTKRRSVHLHRTTVTNEERQTKRRSEYGHVLFTFRKEVYKKKFLA